jgi:hypothetical protein
MDMDIIYANEHDRAIGKSYCVDCGALKERWLKRKFACAGYGMLLSRDGSHDFTEDKQVVAKAQ